MCEFLNSAELADADLVDFWSGRNGTSREVEAAHQQHPEPIDIVDISSCSSSSSSSSISSSDEDSCQASFWNDIVAGSGEAAENITDVPQLVKRYRIIGKRAMQSQSP